MIAHNFYGEALAAVHQRAAAEAHQRMANMRDGYIDRRGIPVRDVQGHVANCYLVARMSADEYRAAADGTDESEEPVATECPVCEGDGDVPGRSAGGMNITRRCDACDGTGVQP